MSLMPAILDRLPIGTRDHVTFVRGEMVRVKAYEILIWVSLSPRHAVEVERGTPRFPALLDTAHTHNFSIQDQHLIRWAGLPPAALRRSDTSASKGGAWRSMPRTCGCTGTSPAGAINSGTCRPIAWSCRAASPFILATRVFRDCRYWGCVPCSAIGCTWPLTAHGAPLCCAHRGGFGSSGGDTSKNSAEQSPADELNGGPADRGCRACSNPMSWP
jgi:hypothetical protein